MYYIVYNVFQGSSTYESIYEPINPRPPSGMSSRSNYSLYTPYVKGGTNNAGGPQEAEVDALTDLLVQSMDSSVPDSDIFGKLMEEWFPECLPSFKLLV